MAVIEIHEVPKKPCKHLGPKLGTRHFKDGGGCLIYQCKHEVREETTLTICENCPHFEALRKARIASPPSPPMPKSDSLSEGLERAKKAVDAMAGPKIARRCKQPEGVMINRWNRPVELGDLFFGGHLFLILSGPSLNALPLDRLNERGIVTMGVNNSPCRIRTNFMTFVDSADKFHHSIWRDPGITKFIPKQRFKKKTKVKQPDGEFVWSLPAKVFPNVIGYKRNAYFDPQNWLWEPSINWGNSKNASAENCRPRELNVMFAALRLGFFLGFRNIYLLGCDWKMDQQQPYSFAQGKHDGGCLSNNSKYKKVEVMLKSLLPYFQEAGLHIFNCSPGSGLALYPQMDFLEAIERAQIGIDQQPDTWGWYEMHGRNGYLDEKRVGCG